MMNMQNINTNKAYISKLILIVTDKNYKDIYKRSFKLNVNNGNINGLKNIMDNSSRGVNDISSLEVASVVPDIMTVDSVTNGMAGIPNGWGTERIRFMMEVVTGRHSYSETVSYIQGYSDYNGSTASGVLDDKMVLFINSITTVSRCLDPVTNRVFVRPLSSYNLIQDEFGGVKYKEIMDDSNIYLIRPLDIMNDIHCMHMYNNDVINVVNTSGILSDTVVTSNRNNSDPISYFTKTMNGYIEAKAATFEGSDTTALYRNAIASPFIRENRLTSEPFIMALASITNEILPYKFTIQTLKIMDKDINNKTILINKTQNINVPMYSHFQTMDTEETFKATPESIKANIIVNSLNSVLVDNMVTKISLGFTNSTGPIPAITILDVKSFIDGINYTPLLEKIRHHIRSVLLPLVSDNNSNIIDVTFESDLLGDTNVGISINLQPSVVFRYPAFADSLFTPMLTTSANKSVMVDDFSSCMDITYN